MNAEFSTNIGLANNATKQYAITRQVQPNKDKVDEEGVSRNEKGMLSDEQVVDMASPTIDAYITALATQDEVQKAKKKYLPTVESLKERLEKSLEARYDNAHNMLAEAFYSFRASTCSSVLGLLGADLSELEAIKKKAYDQAKLKVKAGYERLATAYAEYEIYAS